MKKTALWICLCLFVASPSFAACDSGTEITGKNGHVYCKSNITMNWYTAFSWCDAQGRTLATMEQMCDDVYSWDVTTGTGKCLNMEQALSEGQSAWSTIPYDSGRAINVNLSTANVGVYTRMGDLYALCW